ncbi:hypothetical protein FRC03_001291 [Tulasnella sp. 419]|nr:hypothetical protein FRC03_001291 [Tulasnella sp. 419]
MRALDKGLAPAIVMLVGVISMSTANAIHRRQVPEMTFKLTSDVSQPHGAHTPNSHLITLRAPIFVSISTTSTRCKGSRPDGDLFMSTLQAFTTSSLSN